MLRRIEDLELTEAVHSYPAELSGGMQKRVALARALVTDPKVVLFDEPTTGQDPIRKNMIMSMISHYRKRFGFTAVLISHDIPDVFFISDRIVILWEGSIGFEGTYDELVKLKHPMIDEFLKSLEGFGDELTGLLSAGSFRGEIRLPAGQEHGPAQCIGRPVPHRNGSSSGASGTPDDGRGSAGIRRSSRRASSGRPAAFRPGAAGMKS